MNKDELEGKAEAAKGRLKHQVGHLTKDQELHDEGLVDEARGETKEALGRARRKVGEAIEDVGERLKR
jgi:uncharacterized protein YjbJ (UPF0337 family)